MLFIYNYLFEKRVLQKVHLRHTWYAVGDMDATTIRFAQPEDLIMPFSLQSVLDC